MPNATFKIMNQDFSILNSINESAAIINSDGVILFVNTSWNLFSSENGGSESTSIGANYLKVCNKVGGSDIGIAENVSAGISAIICKQKNMFEIEYPCHSPSQQRWFILRASRLSTNDELILVMHINITKRKLAEIELENKNEKMQIINDRLHSSLYKIAHDIQGPLNSLIGLIDISKKTNDIASIKMSMDIMNKSSINLKSFVQETLKYISFNPINERLNFDDFLQQQLKSVETLLAANSIEIQLDLGLNKEFYTNTTEFRSIFTNLLYNSIKYYDPEKNKRFINIFFRVEESKVLLKIKDNGIGITKKDLSKLFEQNFQVNPISSEGTGLGLYMVKKSVDLLNGKINVFSDLKNETEFTVELPNKKPDANYP